KSVWLTFPAALSKIKKNTLTANFCKVSERIFMEKLHEPATERRRMTRNSIYRYLYAAPEGRSKQDIADDLALSLPTVHQNLTELLKAGLVRTDGMSESTGGRRAMRLTVAENARF